MLRFRTLAAVLVAAVLATLPMLRSACDFDCADPAPPVASAPGGAAGSSSESHCPQHADGNAPAKPAPNGDRCGHDHHTERVTAARTIPYDAGAFSTPMPAVMIAPFGSQHAPSTAFASSPPLVRPLASAPLRI